MALTHIYHSDRSPVRRDEVEESDNFRSLGSARDGNINFHTLNLTNLRFSFTLAPQSYEDENPQSAFKTLESKEKRKNDQTNIWSGSF